MEPVENKEETPVVENTPAPKPRRASPKKDAKKDAEKDTAPASIERTTKFNRTTPKPQTGKDHVVVVR
jgi:hypothetical protein